jgi:hypothetical protein
MRLARSRGFFTRSRDGDRVFFPQTDVTRSVHVRTDVCGAPLWVQTAASSRSSAFSFALLSRFKFVGELIGNGLLCPLAHCSCLVERHWLLLRRVVVLVWHKAILGTRKVAGSIPAIPDARNVPALSL